MKKTLQFKSQEVAKRIAEYFPNTVVDEDRVIFSDFDDRAFYLAADLEKLNGTDYDCRSLILLEIEISGELHFFRILVDETFKFRDSQSLNKFSLIVDDQVIALAEALRNEIFNKRRTVPKIKEAWLIKNCFEYSLKIYGKGRFQTMQFNPKKISSKSFCFDD